MNFEKQFPSLKRKIQNLTIVEQVERPEGISTPESGWENRKGVDVEDIQKHCLDKAKVKQAILRNFIDDKFRRQLLKELGLE